MAYIDPEGMFGGDRMAMLSDAAKLAFPWFWCASNSVGRVELNYREFANGPFRQFRKHPTEKEFWGWVAEFHESFLMYAYQVNGKAWGQWDVSARYLPKYKTKADERTPAPTARDYLEWHQAYTERRVTELSTKCPVFNISGNFPKPAESPEKFPIGEEKEEELEEEEEKPLSASDDAGEPVETGLFPAPPQRDAAWWEAQHERWYSGYWCRRNKKASRRAFRTCVLELVRDHGMSHEDAVNFLINMASLDKQKWECSKDWDWRQNMHPATWLNGKRWEDEGAKARAPASQTANEIRRSETEIGIGLMDQIRGIR